MLVVAFSRLGVKWKSPITEVLDANMAQIASSGILTRLGLMAGEYILLSAHREENIDIEETFFSLMNAVNTIAEKNDMPILNLRKPRSTK